MFNWFWEFLYMLSKTIFRLIDGLILCANMLCGIDSISLNGEETDFLTYLIFSDEIGFAFRVSAILATILLVVFTVFMIIRTIAKDKAEGTPAQIAVKSFKTILMFFIVPLVMVAFMTLGNAFVTALYGATVQTAASPGAFLFSAFAEDGGMQAEYAELFRTGELNYNDTALVSNYMVLADFPFLFSWLAGGVVLFGVASAMLVFVDRVLSLVILYIAAPISISTSVLDDGARFKLWRDQFLSKFIMGYGMILAINIYALVCGLVMSPDVVFFAGEDDASKFLDLLMKLLVIGGGALTMQKSMALVGNLVSQGAGSNELRDSMSAGALAKMAAGAATSTAKFAGKTALGAVGLPFKPLKSIVSDAASLWSRNKASQWLGLDKDSKSSNKDSKDSKEKSDAKNNDKPSYGSNPDAAKDAIDDKSFKLTDWGNNNSNNNSSNKNGNGMVNKAIEGNKKDDKGQNSNQNDTKPKEGNKK